MLKQLIVALCRVVVVVSAVLFGIRCYIAQPSLSSSKPSTESVNYERMQTTVRTLSEDYYPRNLREMENLAATVDYLKVHFEQAGGVTEIQEYEVSKGDYYQNLRCFFGDREGPRLVIGAHYDTCGNTPGADDNASGIAGLIELAYLIGENPALGNVELVAYTLEEPPYFGSKHMGSYIHAQSLVEEGVPVLGVIVLEMIGYFINEPNSQDYPSLMFKLFYPSRGNFIAVVGNMKQRSFTKRVKLGMKGATGLPVYSLNGPAKVPGIDFSDHRNYWPHGYDAVMVTDTAFYRNKYYHTADDTWDRLDYSKMGDVILGVYSAVKQIFTAADR
ncbi:MAG: M28 family peptidase [Coraliomargarita sp.]